MVGYTKNYKKQDTGLQFCLIPKLISWLAEKLKILKINILLLNFCSYYEFVYSY